MGIEHHFTGSKITVIRRKRNGRSCGMRVGVALVWVLSGGREDAYLRTLSFVSKALLFMVVQVRAVKRKVRSWLVVSFIP